MSVIPDEHFKVIDNLLGTISDIRVYRTDTDAPNIVAIIERDRTTGELLKAKIIPVSTEQVRRYVRTLPYLTVNMGYTIRRVDHKGNTRRF